MNIEFTIFPKDSDINFLTEKINEETMEYGDATPFAFFMRDEEGRIIAGANGSIIFGCIYTDQLWVNIKHRRSGIAKKLMDKVHDYGKNEGCKIATVNSMSFQKAKSFYEKLGYIVDFERSGYNFDSSCLFMRKNLLR